MRNPIPIPIDPDGLPFIAIPAIAGIGLLLFGFPWSLLGGVSLLLAACCAAFFRDPERTPPLSPGAVLSPADGKVVEVSAVPDTDWPGGTASRVAIFLSLFDVHVSRSPVSGIIASLRHRPGLFHLAFASEASRENERAELTVDGPEGEIPVRLIAGVVARRIVIRVGPGDRIDRGGRIGIIRFGSRAEVYFPPGFRPAVQPGDRVRGGETVLARREAPADSGMP